MSMIFCPQCGTENEEANKECRACAFDFTRETALVCPICQFENHPFLDKCRQCGTDLTAVSAVSDPDSEDSEADLARITGPLPALPTRKFTPGENDEGGGDASKSEDFDEWLDEVISRRSDDEFNTGSGDEGPVWAVGSGLALGDTMELQEESLPDWLKSLKDADEVPAEKSEPAPGNRMASWLDDSKLSKLGKTEDLESEFIEGKRGDQSFAQEKQVDQKSDNGDQFALPPSSIRTTPLSPEGLEAEDKPEQQDDWLVELAAMGAASEVRE